MADRTHEETEQAADAGGEAPEAAVNGDAPPSGTLGTGVALTIGGAVVGALVALLRGRRTVDSGGAAANDGSGLADDLVARASAAARGDESRDEHDEHEGHEEHEDVEEPAGESDADAVGVAQGVDSEAEASADRDGDDPSAHEGSKPGADATSAPEHEATEVEDEDETEATVSAGEERRDEGGSARDEDAGGHEETGALAAARAATRQLGVLTGRTPEAVLGVERRDGSWRVTLEVVEVARTPPTTDVLGRYEVELDGDGELIEYHQVGRYVRGRALEGD